MEDVYTGAASFGRGYSLFSAVIVTIVSIALIIGGVVMFFSAQKDAIVTGTVNNVNGKTSTDASETCDKDYSTNNKVQYYSCSNIGVSYTVDGKAYTSPATLNLVSTLPVVHVGDSVQVDYQLSDPTKISISENFISKSTLAKILIGVGIVLFILTWLNVYLVNRFKFIAAVEGTSDAINLARRL